MGLTERDMALLRGVFLQVPELREVILFGSRAKGTHRPNSDVDLALIGLTGDLAAEAVAEALDNLPLPYRFDVKAYDTIHHRPLREHIDRVGVSIYRREA